MCFNHRLNRLIFQGLYNVSTVLQYITITLLEPPYDDIADDPSTISSSEVRKFSFFYFSLLKTSVNLSHETFYCDSRTLLLLKNQQRV